MEMSSQTPDINLEPVMYRGQVLLYDIYVKGVWCGSRRTIAACALFLGMPELAKNFEKVGL